MEKSKIITLLKTFSKDEFKNFERFIQQPFFNTNENLVRFYKYLRKSAPKFSKRRIDRFKVYQYLFPNDATYKEIKLQQYMSELVKLVERFWAYNSFCKEPIQEQLYIARIYQKRNLPTYWQSSMQKAQQNLEANKANMAAVDLHYCELQLELAIHESIEAKQRRDFEPNLQNVLSNLNTYYLVNVLQYYCKAMNYKRFKAIDYQVPIIEEVLAHIEEHRYENQPIIIMYFYAIKTLLEAQNETHYKKLKTLLLEKSKELFRKDAQNLFALARNYCIYQMNNRNVSYYYEIFNLYQIEIEKKLILRDGQMTPSTFQNIVTTGLMLSKFDWLENFIFDFSDYVTESMFYQTLAKLRFHQKRYKETIELIDKANFAEILDKISSRTILLQSYFELFMLDDDSDDFDEKIENYLTSFSVFLNRHREEIERHYEYYASLLYFLNKIMKYIWQGNEAKIDMENLMLELKKTPKVKERRLIKSKIKMILEKKY